MRRVLGASPVGRLLSRAMQQYVRRIIDNLEKSRKWVIEIYHTRRIVTFTKEDYAEHFRNHFERGKALSDFLGMIIRLSLAIFAFAYFFKRGFETYGIRRVALALCVVFAGGLAGMLYARIYAIILMYVGGKPPYADPSCY